MKINPKLSTLLIIDFQGRLMPAIQDGQRILDTAIRIASIAKLLGIPIIGTEQSPNSLGNNLPEISKFCNHTVVKDHFDAGADGLIPHLPKDRNQIIVAGCETHVCVLQTILHLLSDGFEVFILVDAAGSRKALDKEIGLNRLSQAGTHLITTEMAAFEWLESAKNPKFKEVLALIK